VVTSQVPLTVFAVGYQLQMSDVNACLIAALVVKFHPNRDWAIDVDPGGPVSELPAGMTIDYTSVPTADVLSFYTARH